MCVLYYYQKISTVRAMENDMNDKIWCSSVRNPVTVLQERKEPQKMTWNISMVKGFPVPRFFWQRFLEVVFWIHFGCCLHAKKHHSRPPHPWSRLPDEGMDSVTQKTSLLSSQLHHLEICTKIHHDLEVKHVMSWTKILKELIKPTGSRKIQFETMFSIN